MQCFTNPRQSVPVVNDRAHINYDGLRYIQACQIRI